MYCGQYILDREIQFDPCVGVVDVVYREWIWPFFSYFSNVEERYFDERDSKVNNIGR